MVDIDQESNLVDKISDVVGFPIWQNIVIYENQTEKSSTFYLPLGFEYGNKTEAIISGIEYEQNGVRTYSFKLTERSEIQEVFSDESKLATYNNFAMEAIYFVYSDFYIFHANYEQFSSKIIEMYHNGLDMLNGQNTKILNLNQKTNNSRSDCRCQLRVGEFLVDKDGNVIKEFKNDEQAPGGPGNGPGPGGNNNGGGDPDVSGGGWDDLWDGNGSGLPPGGPGDTGNNGGSGSSNGDDNIITIIWIFDLNNNNNNNNPPNPDPSSSGGNIIASIYTRLAPRRPTIVDKNKAELRNDEETIITQTFIDCGQDGFTADDLLVGDAAEGSNLMEMLGAADLDCDQSNCLLTNIPLFDRVEEFLANDYIDPCTGEDVVSQQDLNEAINAACEGNVRQAGNTFTNLMNEKLDESISCSNCEYSYVKCDNKEDGICPETFNLRNVGAGYTCQINNIQFNYIDVSGTGNNRLIPIGDICIQISGKDTNGNNIIGDSNELLSEAWNLAQFLTATEFAAVGHSLSSAQYKALFVGNLRTAIGDMFSSSSISSGKCLGNITGNKPIYSIFCN